MSSNIDLQHVSSKLCNSGGNVLVLTGGGFMAKLEKSRGLPRRGKHYQ
jgi:hypothetical protein